MSMKFLSIAGAVVSAAVAVSASTPLESSLSSSRLPSPVSTRSLQDANGNDYAYLDDLTGYSLKYSSCVRVKIPQEYDDDAVEGNVNFYNGRYHAQYKIFATFHVCGDGSGSSTQCSSCDYSTEYATEVGKFMETSLDYWGDYCGDCQQACGGRRRLEERNGRQMNCNTCSNTCKNYYKDGGAGDESAYMECAEGQVDEDGLQLYYGPQCSDDGSIIIGVFYDDECTIKTKNKNGNYPEFDYYKFGSVLSGCLDCSSDDDAGEACGELYGESHHCVSGKDQTGQDNEMSVCSTVKKALTSIDYSGVKKRRHRDMFLEVFFVMLALGAVGSFLFLTYTYYVRHRGEKSRAMLSGDDIHEDQAHQAPPGGTLT